MHSSLTKTASRGVGNGRNSNSNSKQSTKHLKKPQKSCSIESLDYDDQDHMDACFKDSDYGKDQNQYIFLLVFSFHHVLMKTDSCNLSLFTDQIYAQKCNAYDDDTFSEQREFLLLF